MKAQFLNFEVLTFAPELHAPLHQFDVMVLIVFVYSGDFGEKKKKNLESR